MFNNNLLILLLATIFFTANAIQTNGPVLLREENSLNIRCYLSDEESRITDSDGFNWSKDNISLESLPIEDRNRIVEDKQRLSIHNANRNDIGDYECKTKDGKFNAIVSVRTNPWLHFFEDYQKNNYKSADIVEGEKFFLKCEVISDYARNARVEWFIYNESEHENPHKVLVPIGLEDPRIQISMFNASKSTLTIDKVEPSDRYYYVCKASNDISHTNHTILLRVKDKLGPLWPFLGIVVEVVILCAIIFICEKCRNTEVNETQQRLDEVNAPESWHMMKTTTTANTQLETVEPIPSDEHTNPTLVIETTNSRQQKSIIKAKLKKLAIHMLYAGSAVGVLTIILLISRFVIKMFIIRGKKFTMYYMQYFIRFVIIGVTVLIYAVPIALPIAATLVFKYSINVYESIAKCLQLQLTVNVVAVIVAFVSACIIEETPLTVVQILWVNLIIDTLASLAFAIESPTASQLSHKPYSPTEPLITRRMLLNIIWYSINQLGFIYFLLFQGDKFFDIESGMNAAPDSFPTQHFTIIFNTFAIMTIFNEFNSRKIHGERNIFEGLFSNLLFFGTLFVTAITQVLVVQFGGLTFSTAALTFEQWLWCVLFGIEVLLWGQLITTIPTKCRPAFSWIPGLPKS